jgi:hypothetical protein
MSEPTKPISANGVFQLKRRVVDGDSFYNDPLTEPGAHAVACEQHRRDMVEVERLREVMLSNTAELYRADATIGTLREALREALDGWENQAAMGDDPRIDELRKLVGT